MGLKFLQDIVNLDNIQFVNSSGTNAGLINMDGNDLVLSNPLGDILLGDGSADVFIGDGVNNVDIRFEQSGSITPDNSNATLTIGGTGSLVIESPTINTPTLNSTSINNKLTFTTANGYINFDYEPNGDTGQYTTPTKLLTMTNGAEEEVIMQRLSQSGALMIGHDDIVAIAAGDTWSILRDNIGWTGENVILSSEAGFTSYAFPNNDTTWSNRNEFRFYGGSATAAENGLYIGDGSNTQFIDLDRNLKNINTITANSNVDVHGILRVHSGSFVIEDDNSDSVHARIDTNSTEGVLRLNNGANWGMIARGIGNDPRLGAYHNGALRIYGFGAADGADHADDDELARFDFANERFDVNGEIRGDSLDIDGNADISGNIAVSGTVDGVDIATRDAVLTSTTTTANAALPKAGGTMTGQLVVNQNAGTLNLVGTDHTYIQWYPAGTSGGRHAYTGFAGAGTDHFTIANETSGAHINLTTNSGTVNVTGNLSVSGTVDGVDIGANYANWNTAYGWGDHSSAGYLTTHPSISAASSVNNSGKTYIQDITLDSNGHVTGLVSDSLTGSDFIEPGSNGALNSLTCETFYSEDSIAFNLDTDTNSTSTFVIKSDGSTLFSLNESGDLTITGKFVSTYASKATSGDILVDDGGEIKKRTTTELKTDLSLNNVPNTDATNASNLSSGTVPTDRLATTTIAKGGTGATTASAARTALGVDAAGTDNSTDVTLAGSLNYITISGQEITRNAIDLAADVTGTLPQTNLPDDMDSDKVKQICVTNHGFALDSNTSAPNYFPLNNLNETRAGDTAQYYARMIAPYAGRVIKVMVRADADIGNSCSVVLTKLSTSGQSPDGLRDEGTDVETVSSVDCSAINTTHTFTFSSGTFGSGDVVNIGLQKNSSNTANVTAVVVWEYTL